MQRLIDANHFKSRVMPKCQFPTALEYEVDKEPTIKAIPLKVIESWLYSIALNNADNSLGDACEELIHRLDGLERFYKDSQDGKDNFSA